MVAVGGSGESSSGGQGSSVLKLSINVRLSEVAITLTVDKLDASAQVALGDPAAVDSESGAAAEGSSGLGVATKGSKDVIGVLLRPPVPAKGEPLAEGSAPGPVTGEPSSA